MQAAPRAPAGRPPEIILRPEIDDVSKGRENRESEAVIGTHKWNISDAQLSTQRLSSIDDHFAPSPPPPPPLHPYMWPEFGNRIDGGIELALKMLERSLVAQRLAVNKRMRRDRLTVGRPLTASSGSVGSGSREGRMKIGGRRAWKRDVAGGINMQQALVREAFRADKVRS